MNLMTCCTHSHDIYISLCDNLSQNKFVGIGQSGAASSIRFQSMIEEHQKSESGLFCMVSELHEIPHLGVSGQNGQFSSGPCEVPAPDLFLVVSNPKRLDPKILCMNFMSVKKSPKNPDCGL